MSLPSILFFGSGAPARFARVGYKSMPVTMASLVVPAGIMSGPARDERHAHAAFERGELAAAKRRGASRVLAIAEEGTVVGGEEDQRVVVQAEAFQCVENHAHAPVEFLDDIGVQSGSGFAAERVARVDRHMGHDVREVEEERLVLVPLDEVDAELGDLAREEILVGIVAGDFLALEPRQRRYSLDRRVIGSVVVGVGQAGELVEAMTQAG